MNMLNSLLRHPVYLLRLPIHSRVCVLISEIILMQEDAIITFIHVKSCVGQDGPPRARTAATHRLASAAVFEDRCVDIGRGGLPGPNCDITFEGA
jgi:hypothetical protein